MTDTPSDRDDRRGQSARGDRREVADMGGEAVCWLPRVCPECGRLADDEPPTQCPRCGAEIAIP